MDAGTMQFVTLADLEPGTSAVVHRALYSEFRDFYPMLCLRPGERVRCIGDDGSTLLLRDERGRDVRVQRLLARLIEVTGCADESRPP